MSLRFPSIYARSRRAPVRQYVSDSHDDRKTMDDLRRRAMPLTAKGEEIRKHLEQEYGAKKGEQASEDARMSAIKGRLSEVEGKKDAEDVFDSIPAGLDPAKLDAACSMMDALDKRFGEFFSRGDATVEEAKKHPAWRELDKAHEKLTEVSNRLNVYNRHGNFRNLPPDKQNEWDKAYSEYDKIRNRVHKETGLH